MALYGHPFRDEDFNNTYFDSYCPYFICDAAVSADHDLCKAVHDRRVEKYLAYQEEYEFESLEAIKDFENKWNFWLHRHPNSMLGDMGAAFNQKFKWSAEAFLRNGY